MNTMNLWNHYQTCARNLRENKELQPQVEWLCNNAMATHFKDESLYRQVCSGSRNIMEMNVKV